MVGAVLNVLFQNQILGVFSAPSFLAMATFPRMCYDRLIKTKTTLHDAFFTFRYLFKVTACRPACKVWSKMSEI